MYLTTEVGGVNHAHQEGGGGAGSVRRMWSGRWYKVALRNDEYVDTRELCVCVCV